MERVQITNINNLVFNVDYEAYDALRTYLDLLTKYFENEESGREIITDIEARISELFLQYNQESESAIIDIQKVEKMIQTLGTPEVIAGTSQIDDDYQDTQASSQKAVKRLYRDPNNRYIGGVCAGISNWLGISPIISRIIFILAALFSIPFKIFNIGIIIYILFWIIIPMAKTTAQKLQMHGQAININNIEKNIRESLSDGTLTSLFRNFLNEFGEFFTKIFKIIGRIISIIVGFVLFCSGIAISVGLISVFLLPEVMYSSHFLVFNDLNQLFASVSLYPIFYICVILAVSMFALALIFWGSKLLSSSAVKNKVLHLFIALIWISIIITAFIIFIASYLVLEF
jgi:phage shock protein PspC (stress-responsive transcriptional regulator)